MFVDSKGTLGRVVMARILPGCNLISSIEEVCEKNDIEYGVISTCIGSLENASFVYAVPREGEYFGFAYSDPVNIKGPIELLSGEGLVGKNDKGKFQIHLHAMLSDSEMKIYGGHFLDDGNDVAATTEVVITELKGMEVRRDYHEESGFFFFEPCKI